MEIEGKRLLVIGGAGLIGSHVVDELLKEDVKQVLIYDNFSRGCEENIRVALKDSRCQVFDLGGDINQTDLLDKAMHDIDGVFHLAALWLLHCHDFPESAFKVNIEGTFNVIMAAIRNGVERVVYSSSASVYGDACEVPMSEEHPYHNDTFYGATKIAGEHMFVSLGKRFGLNWAGLRYMNVYGPRQDYEGAYVAVMHRILDRLESGQRPQIYGDGSQQYDFVAVEDVARANVCAMKSDVTGKCYNVGRGIGTSIKELAELLIRLSKCDAALEYLPEGMTFVTNRIGSIEAAKRDLGYLWEIDLEEGMQRLIDWRRVSIAQRASRCPGSA